ncbi:ATP-dependent Clp protease proteolytic subunit [uncultured Duncaniella sp.]|uniref:Clp protease ClpP n=1 Tax=uncultured Duncaniella sp. TaxID=2768039 RepID=UPI00267619E1|nr:Clp protease ClpP [uncultured Duncaniella sp.]
MPKNYNLHLKGSVGYWNFSSDQVSYVLDKYKDGEVNVLINSLGGYAYEGMAISSLFRNHGNVHVHYMGANASAATIASMGAKRVSMDVDAIYLVHQCSNLVFEWDYFNADELDKKIKDLEKQKKNLEVLDCTIAGMYARRCKKPQADLLELMKHETWLTAQEALEWGFVDEITTYEDDEKPGFDDATVSAMASAGMPIPKCALKKDSPLSRIAKSLGALFSQDKNTQPSNIIMPNLETLEQVLGGSISVADGGATLQQQQLTAINDRISADAATIADKDKTIEEKDRVIADKDNTIADLNKKVKDLSNLPAVPSASVVEPGGSTPDPDRPSDDVRANVEDLLSQLPDY